MRGEAAAAAGPAVAALAWLETLSADMGCFCAVPEEFYCEVLLLDESKLTLTTQQQGIKVGTAGARCGVRDVGVRGFVSRLSPLKPGRRWKAGQRPQTEEGVCRGALTWSCLEK